MPRGRTAEDLTTLQMALVGYKYERDKIDEKIRQIEGQLKGRKAPAGNAGGGASKPVRRELSAAARRRIAAAQRKRWAEHRKAKAAQAKG